MDERVPMTPRGYAALKAELQRLVSVERPANIKDIEEAIAHGDLSENAEYHAAKRALHREVVAAQVRELRRRRRRRIGTALRLGFVTAGI